MDHILPKAWYTTSTPSTIQRWTAPTCVKCNSRMGKREEELLLKMGLATDPNDPEFGEIANRAMRSIQPERASSPRDARIRAAKRARIMSDMEIAPRPIPSSAIVPNFGPTPGHDLKSQGILLIDPKDLEEFAKKIVRGIAYIYDDKTYLDPSYEWTVKHVADVIPTIEEIIAEDGRKAERGPGISVHWSYIRTDRSSRILYFEIFRRWKAYVIHAPPDLAIQAAEEARQKGLPYPPK